MPETEKWLQDHLGDCYSYNDWKHAFDAVFTAKDDIVVAIVAIESLQKVATQQHNPTQKLLIPQLTHLEDGLIKSVTELKNRKCIVGEAPTLEDLLNPAEENEIGDSPFQFPGGDDEILAQVANESAQDSNKPESDDDEKEEEDSGLSFREGIDLCEKLEKACIIHSDAEGVAVLELQKQLRRFRGHFRWLEFASQKQVTLDTFWRPDVQMDD